jgi:hypothetical protein
MEVLFFQSICDKDTFKMMMCFSIGPLKTIILSRNGLPFQARHEIHLDTFQLLFLALSSPKSLMVVINGSTSLIQFHLCSTLSNFISFST